MKYEKMFVVQSELKHYHFLRGGGGVGSVTNTTNKRLRHLYKN